MHVPTELLNSVLNETQYLPATEVSVSVEQLTQQQRREVLAFLAERPIHTVCLVGLIRDNGLEDPFNRGTFYACRNSQGRLEGVALIGHTTLIEARSEQALKEFALIAKTCSNTFMIMGEQERIERFWNYHADEHQEPAFICRELLFELRQAIHLPERVKGLRLGTLDDLELIVPVHAEMAEEESGINPAHIDPVGFRQRCARRIERGRVWVLMEKGRLIFKADVQADTPEVSYLEGIYVNPAKRGQAIGRRCLAQLTETLLRSSQAVCLLVNENNQKARALYEWSNFKLCDTYYKTIRPSKNSQRATIH